jgi:hypothetical protein
MILMRQMDPSRITPQDGRWSLRHVKLEEEDGIIGYDVHVFLESARAPGGTVARDLKPETVELIGLESDGLVIPLALIARITEWPPS